MSKWVILLFLIFLVSCEINPLWTIGHIVATAETCGVDTSEFYKLASKEEKIQATTASIGRSGTSSCWSWNYGDKDKRQKAYDILIKSMQRRVPR